MSRHVIRWAASTTSLLLLAPFAYRIAESDWMHAMVALHASLTLGVLALAAHVISRHGEPSRRQYVQPHDSTQP